MKPTLTSTEVAERHVVPPGEGLVIGGAYYDGNEPCDPRKPINHGTPLWVVYGHDCFPSLLCCRIKQTAISRGQPEPIIWGYSVYEGEPGFRTLGQRLSVWMRGNPGARFYRVQKDALAYIAYLTRPACT